MLPGCRTWRGRPTPEPSFPGGGSPVPPIFGIVEGLVGICDVAHTRKKTRTGTLGWPGKSRRSICRIFLSKQRGSTVDMVLVVWVTAGEIDVDPGEARMETPILAQVALRRPRISARRSFCSRYTVRGWLGTTSQPVGGTISADRLAPSTPGLPSPVHIQANPACA